MAVSADVSADALPTLSEGVVPDSKQLLEELGGPPPLWRWLGTPALLAGAFLALYLYVSGRELDRIEAPNLNADFIRQKVVEHVQLTLVSTALVILIAVPLGVLLTRPTARRFAPAFLAVANIGQAVPSIGVLALLAITVGIGFDKAIYALVLYAILPVLRNTMVGLKQVDHAVIEAGRGMGMTKLAVLGRVELPLAVPIILAGVRTALVINVGTAALATFTSAGGLGVIVVGGISTSRETTIVTGAVLTAILALSIDWVAGVVEDVLRPKGL